MTILMLGDLHNAEHGKDNCDLLAACRRERPDLVLCVGDMSVGVPGAPFDGRSASCEDSRSLLRASARTETTR